jgi:DNA-binding NtrC family response regulator
VVNAQAGADESRTIIVFERQPYWEPELRRQLHDHEASIRACRTLSDLEQMAGDGADCVVVADLAERPAELLRWLSRRLMYGRTLPVIFVTNMSTAAVRWYASEAGALAIVSEDCGGHHLARLCRRQWGLPAGS